MAELFVRLKLPIVLGELLAGMIVGPFAIGSLIMIQGEHLVILSNEVKILGEIGAIVILFMAGLEMTPREFIRGGKASFTVGTLGVIVPFFVGFFVFKMFGFEAFQAMLVATALTATSIAISVQVLSEFGKLKTPEARLIIGAAVVDDVLAIAVLSIVSSVGAGDGVDIVDMTFTIFKVLAFFAAMAIAAIFLVPRLVNSKLWKASGSIEGIVTAAFFGTAGLAAWIGLSPILGAFVVGMALST
ncbi:MAG: cation:proton antiporter, partial [Thaumarchaeota archaeon]|nr:cation:proton antiporter [Nitrososphaerota archaeon]